MSRRWRKRKRRRITKSTSQQDFSERTEKNQARYWNQTTRKNGKDNKQRFETVEFEQHRKWNYDLKKWTKSNRNRGLHIYLPEIMQAIELTSSFNEQEIFFRNFVYNARADICNYYLRGDFQQGINSRNTSQRGVWISLLSLKNRKSPVKAISLWHWGSTGKSDRKYSCKKSAHWTKYVLRRKVD